MFQILLLSKTEIQTKTPKDGKMMKKKMIQVIWEMISGKSVVTSSTWSLNNMKINLKKRAVNTAKWVAKFS